jgi:hypothetical protein
MYSFKLFEKLGHGFSQIPTDFFRLITLYYGNLLAVTLSQGKRVLNRFDF